MMLVYVLSLFLVLVNINAPVTHKFAAYLLPYNLIFEVIVTITIYAYRWPFEDDCG